MDYKIDLVYYVRDQGDVNYVFLLILTTHNTCH